MRLRRGNPADAGLDPRRLQHAYDLLSEWSEQNRIPGAALAVARHGVLLEPRACGRKTLDADSVPMSADSVFLVASVTKPVTATAAMLLVERGQVALQDRVCSIVPEFTGQGKEEIQLFHLLTHTSGLPDMLPDNLELRQRQAPLPDFIERICQVDLLFPPGTRISYQSMGTAMAGEIIERISGMPLRDFFQQEICTPLGMDSTSLGIRADLAERVAQVRVPDEQQGAVWHWNGPYWQNIGAPWGGMFATVQDLVVLLQTFLNRGAYGTVRLLGTSTARAMIRDQTSHLPGMDDHSRRSQAWGLGWRLQSGELGSPNAFGHGGATGTLVGADPQTGLAWAVFTTQPGAPLHYVANALNAAVVD